MKTRIKMGQFVVCRVTGFSGRVVGILSSYSGFIRMEVQAVGLTPDGKMKECMTIDESALDPGGSDMDLEPIFPIVPPKFKMLDMVEDIFSPEFSGTIISLTHTYNGCIYYGIQAIFLDKDSKVVMRYLLEPGIRLYNPEPAVIQYRPADHGIEVKEPSASIPGPRNEVVVRK